MPTRSYLQFPNQSHESLPSSEHPSRSRPFDEANDYFIPPVSPDSPGSHNLATIRARRYTAPSQFEDSTVRPSKQAFLARPLPKHARNGSPYSRPRSESIFPSIQEYPGFPATGYVLGASQYSLQESAREAAWLVDEGDRRRSGEEMRLGNMNSAQFDEETLKHSRIQERRRLAQPYAPYMAETSGHKSWSTSELPYETVTPPTPLDDLPSFPIPDPVNSRESAPRFSNYFQPQWWKGHSRRKSKQEEEQRLEAEARCRFEDALALYESRWNLLNMSIRSPTPLGAYSPPSSAFLISFNDIPWPVIRQVRSLEDICALNLKEFWLSRYLPGGRATKDRLREALLRWHPDRFEGRYLPKVRPEDRSKVMKAVGIIVRYLNNELMSYGKHW